MAHFAKLNDNNIVEDIHVVENYVIEVNGVESEQAGIDFLKQLHGDFNWKQTSYNGTFRKNFASIGSHYDPTRDAFIKSKPFLSWILNEDTCIWEAPTPKPEGFHNWDEESQSWIVPLEEEHIQEYMS